MEAGECTLPVSVIYFLFVTRHIKIRKRCWSCFEYAPFKIFEVITNHDHVDFQIFVFLAFLALDKNLLKSFLVG